MTLESQLSQISKELPSLHNFRPGPIKTNAYANIYQLIPRGRPCMFWCCNSLSPKIIAIVQGRRKTLKHVEVIPIEFSPDLGIGKGTIIEGAITKQCGPNSFHFYRLLYFKSVNTKSMLMEENLHSLLSIVEPLKIYRQASINVPFTLSTHLSLGQAEELAKYKVFGVRGINLKQVKVPWQGSLGEVLKFLPLDSNHRVFYVCSTDLPDVYNLSSLDLSDSTQPAAVQSLASSSFLNCLFGHSPETAGQDWIEESDDEAYEENPEASQVQVLCKKNNFGWEPVCVA